METKTIEERAHEFAYRNYDGFFTGREPAEESGYIQGATKQREIDIQRAVEWMESKLYVNSVTNEFYYAFRIDDFIQAMKGE